MFFLSFILFFFNHLSPLLLKVCSISEEKVYLSSWVIKFTCNMFWVFRFGQWLNIMLTLYYEYLAMSISRSDVKLSADLIFHLWIKVDEIPTKPTKVSHLNTTIIFKVVIITPNPSITLWIHFLLIIIKVLL